MSLSPSTKLPRSLLSAPLRDASSLQSAINPFVNHSVLRGPRHLLQLVIGGLFLLPLRLLLLLLLIPPVLLFAKLASLGLRPSVPSPLSPLRRAALFPLRLCIRLALLIAGFWRIQETGSPDPRAAVIAPKHVSYWETFFFPARLPCSPIAGANNIRGPVGSVLVALQAILLDRRDPDSRRATLAGILQRCALFQQHPGAYPPLLLFPEGTTANGALISFKDGAFAPGAPVQPVLVSYSYERFDPAWAGGIGMARHLLLTLCQFSNTMCVEWLPCHFPSQQEREDPRLFAENVRRGMAERSGLPMTQHGFEDVLLRVEAERLRLGPLDVTVRGLQERFHGVDVARLKHMMVTFRQADANGDGVLSVGEFAAALGVPETPALREVFDLIDSDGSGGVNFREWLLSVAVLSEEGAVPEETLRFAFQLFDSDGSGAIDEGEFFALLHSLRRDVYDRQTCAGLFAKMDANKNGLIDFEEFCAFAKKNPVLAELFSQALYSKDLYKPGSPFRQ